MPAPKGNTNALKHGLYARHYQPDETKELKRMEANNLLYELMAARSKAEKCQALAEAEINKPMKEVKNIVAYLTAWDFALNTVGALASRIAILTGENTTLQDSLTEALSGMRQFDPEDEVDPR
jgi:hypothetical protein